MSAHARRDEIVSAPIGPTLFKITLPMLFALVAIMSLGLVDSYFISFLGTAELAAIGFIMPITSMVMSIALGIGMAISSLNSKLIGAKQMDNAARLITDGLGLTIAVSLLVVAFLWLFLDAIFKAIGADDATLVDIRLYMNIWIWSVLPTMFMQVISSTFRSLGDTKTSASIAVMVTIINLVLDPLLIFGLGPFPELGIKGAALATLIAVGLSSFYALYKLTISEKLIVFNKPERTQLIKNIKDLLEIGIPAVLANLIVPLAAAIITTIVAQHGASAVAGYGVGVRIEAVSLIVVYALSSTLPMFIGQNIGAQRNDRIRQAIRLSFRFVVVIQLVWYALIALGAPFIAELFSQEQSVQDVIVWFLMVVPISYGLSGVVILINVSLNVLGRPKTALYINLIRLAVLYLPLSLLGSYLAGMQGIFISIAISNLLAMLIANFLLKRVLIEHQIIVA